MIEDFVSPVGAMDGVSSLRQDDVVEWSLLLPGWQALRLEKVAQRQGTTAAAMVRHFLRDFLTPGLTQPRLSSLGASGELP